MDLPNTPENYSFEQTTSNKTEKELHSRKTKNKKKHSLTHNDHTSKKKMINHLTNFINQKQNKKLNIQIPTFYNLVKTDQ